MREYGRIYKVFIGIEFGVWYNEFLSNKILGLGSRATSGLAES